MLAGVVLAAGAYLGTRTWTAATFPYFIDESIVAGWALPIDRDLHNALSSLTQGIRPGVPWLTFALQQLGIAPLTGIRIVTIGAGLISLGAGALLAHLLGGVRAAAAFALLATVTPYTYLYDVVGGRDTLVGALVVVSFLLQLELARRPQPLLGLLLGVAFASIVVVKETGQIALALLPLSLVFFPWPAPDRRRRLLTWAGCAAGALAMAAAADLLLRSSPAFRELRRVHSGYGVYRPASELLHDPLAPLADQWPPLSDALAAYLTLPLLAFLAAGLVLGLRRHRALTAVVAFWAAATTAALVWIGLNFFPRYLMTIVPLLLVLAAYGLAEAAAAAWRALRGSWRAPVVAAGIAAALAPAALFDWRVSTAPETASYTSIDRFAYITGWPSGLGHDEVIHELRRLAAGHELRVGTTDNEHSTLRLLVLDDPDIVLVDADQAAADPSVHLFFVNRSPVPTGYGDLRPVYVYRRPDNGTPIGIYRRA